MIRLTRVELRRMSARRVIQLAALAVVVVVGLGLFGLHQQVAQSTSDQREAREAYEQVRRDWELHGAETVEQCRADERAEQERTGDPSLDFGCEDIEPRLEHFLTQAPPRDQASAELLRGLGYPVLFVAFAVGATATAAEFTHRTMGTWLTFEPRRGRVLVSKVAAAAVGTLPLGLAFVALGLLGVVAVYAVAGVGDTMTSELPAGTVPWTAVRVAVLTAAAGLGGAAGGLLLRHTGVVLGVLIGYFVAFEAVLVGLFQGLARWTLTLNVDAWLAGGASRSLFDCTPDGTCTEQVVEVSQLQAGAYLGVLLVVVVGLAWARFARGDID